VKIEFTSSLRHPLFSVVVAKSANWNENRAWATSAGIKGSPEGLRRREGTLGEYCREISGFELLGGLAIGCIEETVGLPKRATYLLAGSVTERSRGLPETLGSVELSLPQDTAHSQRLGSSIRIVLGSLVLDVYDKLEDPLRVLCWP